MFGRVLPADRAHAAVRHERPPVWCAASCASFEVVPAAPAPASDRVAGRPRHDLGHVLRRRAPDRRAAARRACSSPSWRSACCSRAAPQLNVFALGFPVKILLTLSLAARRRRRCSPGAVSTHPDRIVEATSAPVGTGRRASRGRGRVEKTEKPTPKRRKEARKEGQVAKTRPSSARGWPCSSSTLPAADDGRPAARHVRDADDQARRGHRRARGRRAAAGCCGDAQR